MRNVIIIFLIVGSSCALMAQITSHAMRQQVSQSSQTLGRPVARVNGTVLTDRDLLREMYTIFPYARQHNGGFPKAMEEQIRAGALKMIVFEELVYQDAERRKLTIPAAKLDRAVQDFRKQFPSQQDYEQFLKTELNNSTAILREKVRRSLLIEQVLATEVGNKANVSDAEVKAYYEKNAEHFMTPESFAFQTISILPPEKASIAQLKEARKRADDALKAAKATKNYEEFGVLAEKISEDDFRVMMGDHKSAERDKLPPPVLQALLAMQVGQTSELIQVGQAYTIVRLNGHQAAGKQKFEDVKKPVRESMEKNRSEQLRSALDKRLRATAKVEVL